MVLWTKSVHEVVDGQPTVHTCGQTISLPYTNYLLLTRDIMLYTSLQRKVVAISIFWTQLLEISLPLPSSHYTHTYTPSICPEITWMPS